MKVSKKERTLSMKERLDEPTSTIESAERKLLQYTFS